MVGTYFESTIFKCLTNEELIKKQKIVNCKLETISGIMNIDKSIVESLNMMAEIISDEIMNRLENGTMDEDELEDDF